MRTVIAALCLALAISCSNERGRAEAPALDFVERVLGGDPARPLPMVVALHGLGDTPEGFTDLYESLDVHARLIAPRAPDPYAVGTSWFPIDDRKRAPAAIRESARRVVALIDELVKTRPTRGKPIVTGFSQGGYLSYAIAAYHNDRIAAALPIAGALPPVGPGYRKPQASFRVIAFHGESDSRVSYKDGADTVARLKKAGFDASLTGYPNVGHTISTAMHGDYARALRRELARLK